MLFVSVASVVIVGLSGAAVSIVISRALDADEILPAVSSAVTVRE